jgi:hypothetical protein
MDGMGSWWPKMKFLPLILTVCGAAGTGKSVIINIIVSYTRRMFDDIDVVHAIAPTAISIQCSGGNTTYICGYKFAEHEEGNEK